MSDTKSTKEELAKLMFEYADAQDKMARDAKEDGEHWHHVCLRDVLREAAKCLSEQEP